MAFRLRVIPAAVALITLVGIAQAGIAQETAPQAGNPVGPLDTLSLSQKVAAAEGVISRALPDYPGFSVTVAQGDRIVWSAGYGVADIEAETPVDEHTLFSLYSISKTMTGVALGKLAEEGMIDLDQPITEIVPDLPDRYAGVTARLLAGHLGGIRHYRPRGDWVRFASRHCETTDEALAHFIGDDLIGEPGSVREYSTHGYALLSRVIAARNLNGGYMDWMRKAVFDPAGMSSTHLDDPGNRRPRRATGYERRAGRLNRIPDYDSSCKFGGGGLVTTTGDMARFGIAFYNGELLNPETMTLVTTPFMDGDGESTDYGFGMGVGEFEHAGDTMSYASHSGASPGGRTYLMMVPSHRTVVALAGNIDGPDLSPIAIALVEIFVLGGEIR